MGASAGVEGAGAGAGTLGLSAGGIVAVAARECVHPAAIAAARSDRKRNETESFTRCREAAKVPGPPGRVLRLLALGARFQIGGQARQFFRNAPDGFRRLLACLGFQLAFGDIPQALELVIELPADLFELRHRFLPLQRSRAVAAGISGIIDRPFLSRKETACRYPFAGATNSTAGAARPVTCSARSAPRRARGSAPPAERSSDQPPRNATSAAPTCHFRWPPRAARSARCCRRRLPSRISSSG